MPPIFPLLYYPGPAPWDCLGRLARRLVCWVKKGVRRTKNEPEFRSQTAELEVMVLGRIQPRPDLFARVLELLTDDPPREIPGGRRGLDLCRSRVNLH